ncbi:hypothetical protein CEXT_237961 [Caerostris extrusa]|uniref:Uncharacterized protein n=1 Tax=Caerostris extrusa TaxID=172846 RepID=A0AAV4QBL9_CAEEX|nr:hypothetical protein CEXT_237961 [Caerostris extrusa]
MKVKIEERSFGKINISISYGQVLVPKARDAKRLMVIWSQCLVPKASDTKRANSPPGHNVRRNMAVGLVPKARDTKRTTDHQATV